MYHKVFINHVEVIFSNKEQSGIQRAPQFSTIEDLLALLKSDEVHEKEIWVMDHSDDLWRQFLDHHTLIEAAGGMVENDRQELLVIKRLGYWDLPKGKLEKNEKAEEGAVREVEEECGIHQLEIVGVLPSTYHTYELKGKPILKKTYWFKMICDGKQQLVPQVEEDITEVKFMTKVEVKAAIDKTYASLIPLFYTYLFGNE